MELESAPCWAYLLACSDGTYYAGWTDNLDRRLAAHNRGTGAKYTRSRRPVRLVYREPCATRGEAMEREAWLKTLTHRQKDRLVAIGQGKRPLSGPRLLVWDFNGTILDDAALGQKVVGIMLARRGLPPLGPRRYREIFDFPVEGYYRKAGFDLEGEPFSRLAEEYMALYLAGWQDCPLQKGALSALRLARKLGISQIILSATQQKMLENQVAQLHLDSYFDQLVGTGDIHARGKLEEGRAWMAQRGCHPGEILYIGDTLHDAQMARALGVACVLVPGGHQSPGRLRQAEGAVVLDRPGRLPAYLSSLFFLGEGR